MTEQKVQTLERALDLIELLAIAKNGLGVTEISQQIGLPKSTVFRLLAALVRRGYAEKDSKTSTYKLGLRFIEISGLFLKKLELKTEALPVMRRLAEIVGQPVHLAVLDGQEAIYIEKVELVNSIRMYSQIGKRVPVYCSAIGKMLLAGLAPELQSEILDRLVFKKHTENTILTKETLVKELQTVRNQGWAVDNEEHEKAVRCIAAPVYDYTRKVIAAVSVSGDKRVIRPERDVEIAGYVMKAAQDISRRMGFVPCKVTEES